MGRNFSRDNAAMLTADPLLSAATEAIRQDTRRSSIQRLSAFLVLPILASCFTANPLLTIFSIVTAVVLPLLLWRPGEPPVLLFCCGLQWLQVTTVLHYANFAGADLVSAYGGNELQMAVGLGLVGLLALAFGARLGIGRLPAETAQRADQEALRIPVPLTFVWFIASFGLSSICKVVSDAVPAVAQALVAVVTIKWALLYLVCMSAIQQRRHYAFLWAAIGVEFFTGVLGYFSTFKSGFFLLIVVALASRHLWNARRVLLAITVSLLLVVSSIVWSAIKEDYREFLNQGSKMQEAVVPIPERIDKLEELVSGLNDEGFFHGVDTLIARVGYVTYFALTIGNVPDHLPYENGRLWLDAVKHVFMPRALFPEKGIIDDSARTSYYTGVVVAGMEQGTSISIGYMGESYIDFGPIGMFVPIFLLGLLFGFVYRLFVKYARYKIIGFATATSVLLFAAYNFETSNVKILGGMLSCAIVTGIFIWLGGPLLAGLLRLREK
jgi:hypothetical protein